MRPRFKFSRIDTKAVVLDSSRIHRHFSTLKTHLAAMRRSQVYLPFHAAVLVCVFYRAGGICGTNFDTTSTTAAAATMAASTASAASAAPASTGAPTGSGASATLTEQRPQVKARKGRRHFRCKGVLPMLVVVVAAADRVP